MVSNVNGAEWAWIAVPLTALGVWLGKKGTQFVVWMRAVEYQAGQASEYERGAREAIVQFESTIAAKDAEIAALRALNAMGRDGQ